MNALTNTPKLSIDENIKQMYLTYIDEFNEWHLRIMLFLDNPTNYFEDNNRPKFYMAGKSAILLQAYPELASRRDFYDRIVTDLYSRV